MSGILHILDQKRLIAPNGRNLGGDLYFYTTGTLTPATVYSDAALTTPLDQPVQVAAGGLVPAIYLDPDVTYRRRIVWEDATLTTDDVDPYQPLSSAQSSFTQSGTGAVARTVQGKLQEVQVSVTDYGAVNSLLANSTAGFQAAVDRVSAMGGGIVFVPAGSYRLDSVVTVSTNGVVIRGAGMQNTVIVPATAGMNAFLFQRGDSNPIAHCTISDLEIAPSAAITDCIRVIDHFWFTARNVRFPSTGGSFVTAINLYNGATAYLAMLENIFALNPNGQVGVRVGENGTGDIQNVFLYNCHLNNATGSGLRVLNVGGLVWMGGEALSCDRAAVFSAGGADRIKAVFCTNVFFDNATNEELRITVDASTARVSGISFCNCSFNFSQSGQGVLIAGNASIPGRMERVRFDGCDVLLNRQAGITLANCHDIKFSMCNVQGNSVAGTGSFVGLFADTGVTGLQVVGGTYGSGNEFSATQSYGISITSGASQVRIAGADLAGNATGPLIDGGASDVIIRDCVGFRTTARGSATVLSGETSIDIIPALDTTFALSDVLATPQGDTPERWWVEAVSSTVFKIQFASTVGADRAFSWQVRTRGA